MRRFVRRLLACAAVLATCPVPAAAADPTFHPVSNLSNSANRTSDSVDMATDGANVYTVWREQTAPDAEELRFRVSDNHGASFSDGPGGRTILSVAAPHRLFTVRIAASGGNVLVLFSTGEDETHAQFWVLRSADGGASFPSAPVEVSDVDAGLRGDIAINAAGNAHIAMESLATGEILHRRSIDGGATFLPATNISGTADTSRNPRLSVNGSNVGVVWEEAGPDGTSPPEAAFAFSVDGGVSFGSALNLSASAAPSQAPDVVFLDVIHVAWVEDGLVHYRRSADGITFTNAVVVGVPPVGDAARTPALSGVGSLVNIAWTTHNPSGGSDGPFLRRSEDGGVNFGGTLDLGSAGAPFNAVSIGGASPVKIAWPHSSSDSPTEPDVLFLREIACSASWLSAVSDVWTNPTRWSSGVVPGATDDVCLTVAGSYTVTVHGSQSANSVVVGAAGLTGAVLKIEGQRIGSGSPIPATLTVGNGLTNFARITLTSGGTIVSGEASLTVSGGTLTNASGATIDTVQGSQGGSTLSATAINDGTISFGWNSTLNGEWTNNSSVTLAAARTLTLGGTAAFTQASGLLSLIGTMISTGGTFNYNGGEISGTPLVLTSAALNIGPASAGGGTFRMRRDSTVSGNIGPAQTIQIEAERIGSGSPINATLIAAGGFINAGTIQLTSNGTIISGTATLVVPPGSVLTNASSGRIDALQGTQGGRVLRGSFSNNGTVRASWPLTIDGTFTNNNSFIVDDSRVLSMSGGARFVQDAGMLDVDGTFNMVGGIFDFNGGTVDTTAVAAGAVILETSALNFGPASTGMAHFNVRRSSTLTGNIAAGQTVTIEAERIGSGSQINATVTASADFTNGGTIQLTSIGTIVSGTATLAMAGSSVMTITSTGRVETLQGSQGGRVITGSFVNNGTVVIGWSVSLTGANATYTNGGSFVVNDGQTVSIAVASSAFVQAGGTLDIEGTINMNGATFNFNGGAIDAVGGLGNLQNAVLNIGAGSTGAAQLRLRRNSTLTGNIAPGQTITIEAERIGSGSPINATVTVVGNLTNAGTIQLTSIGTIVSGTATLTVADGAVLTNATSGRIETLQGSQGGRAIDGNVVNNGTIVIGWSANLGGTAAIHTNNGVFQVQSTRTLSISGDETFVQGGGTLDVDGTFHMIGATFNFNGGSIDASVGSAILESSALNFGPGSTGAGHLRVRRISTLSGNIAAGQTVTIEAERIGSGSQINATVTVLGHATNAGTIQLTSIGTIVSGTATLAVANGAVLTSASTGRIETLQGSQGGRAINGHVVNNGTIDIGWSATLGGTSAIHTNNGVFHVQSLRTLSIGDDTFVQGGGTLDVDGTFHMTGGTFNFNGGSVDAGAGPAILESSALNFGPGSTGAAHLRVRRISTLSGNIAAGQTVTIEAERIGSGAQINATITVVGNATNAGTIQLTSNGTIVSGSATLAIGAGAVLTNAATGLIETIQGSQGGRFLTGSVRNEGTVAVAANSPATHSGGIFRNVAPGTISGGGTLTLATTSTFFGTGSVTANIVNHGQFNAGHSPGALNITGNYTQSTSGSLNVEIGGPTAGVEYDLIAISGTATLAGTLNVSLFGGFCEAGAFDVLTYPVVAGDFATKNGLNQDGLIFTATRNATFYRLNATGDCVSAPFANNDAYSVNEDGVLTVAAPGVLGNDSDPQHTALTAVLFTNSSHGEVSLNADGSFTYTPTADFFGVDSFAYVANDGTENSAPATVTVTVDGVNDPPNAIDDAATVDEDSGANAINVLTNDNTGGEGGETLSIETVSQGANGVVTIGAGATSVTYTPNPNFHGGDSFTYTIVDGNGGTDTATVRVTVSPMSTTDADNDGVPDDVDLCPGTPAGTIVNATGCAIGQICSATASWKTHGEYVSCVSNAATEFEVLGLITAEQRGPIVSTAAKSDVGKK